MQILEIAHGMGLLKPGSVASRHSALSYEYALKLEEQLKIEQAAYEKKMEERARKEKETGRKTGGSVPTQAKTGLI